MRLSKSRYTAGLQCYRQLWWRAHEPGAPELSANAHRDAVFNQGVEVGVLAQQQVPGGVLIDLPFAALRERVAATQRALEAGAGILYEAAFLADHTFAAVDILERDGDAWRIVEVKSTTRVKRDHLADVALQLHVLRQSGLTVHRAELMHLDRTCTYPDLSNLFTRVDVTERVEPMLATIPAEIGRQLAILNEPLPEVPIGRHCDRPYQCPFKTRCWPDLPEHHIGTLYRAGDQHWDLAGRGIASVDQVPDDVPLHPAAARQVRAVRSGAVVVEPGLGAALAAIPGPVAVIDFETVAPAVPLWHGCHPYDPVPVQFSCHVRNATGAWTHHAWLAADAADPRPELVARLVQACDGAATLLAYHSDFEKRCLELVAAALPALGDPVARLVDRLRDALPLVRDHVYHPAFHGSFSLKSVLPALVSGLGYDRMPIADGTTATRELERLLFGGAALQAAERAHLRDALMRYCELDTWGVARLLERLGELATPGAPAA